MKTILFFLLSVATAFARVGETGAQCLDRYGSPVKKMGDRQMHRKGGLNIWITFENNKAVMLVFSKVGADRLSSEEIDALLELNKSGGEWDSDEKYPWAWKSADGTRRAMWYTGFAIGTAAEIGKILESQVARDKAKEANLEGF
jgi:hypothetical protein